MKYLKILPYLGLLLSLDLQANFKSEIAQSPKGLLMGGAFTAIADDEYTLFYNPAALGRNRGFTFNPLNFSLSGNNFISDSDRFKNLPSGDPSGIADRILDYPVNLQVGTMPGFKIGSFGFNLFANSKTSAILRNAIHPTLDLNYHYDRGFITGLAFGFGRGQMSTNGVRGNRKRFTEGYRVSFGMAVKYINREAIEDQFDLFGSTILTKINEGSTSLQDFKDAFGYSKAKGLGVDLGTEYTLTKGRTNVTAGLSVLDFGDTSFEVTNGHGNVQNQKMTVNSGIALRQDLSVFDWTVSMDMKSINRPIGMMDKFHLGTELAFPVVSLFGGYGEGYFSYGTQVRVWPLKVTLGFYSEEGGTPERKKELKRFMAYLSLFDFSFDI